MRKVLGIGGLILLMLALAPGALASHRIVYHERSAADPGCGGVYANPLNPTASQAETIRFEFQPFVLQDPVWVLQISYTTDGTSPLGASASQITAQEICSFADPTEPDPNTIFGPPLVHVGEGTIPAQPAGTTVKYVIFVRTVDTLQSYANSSRGASCTCQAGGINNCPPPESCMTVFSYTAGAAMAVTVRSLRAGASAAGVVVRWRTASELDLLGFNVYRQVNDQRVRVNARVIRARGAGAYSFLDRKAPRAKAARYWLQALNLDGSRSWYGPAGAAARTS